MIRSRSAIAIPKTSVAAITTTDCFVRVSLSGQMIMNDDTWYVVRNTRGVTGFVGPGSKPVPLSEDEMRNLGFKTTGVVVDFEVGDTIVVMSGAWKDTVGVVKTVNESRQSLTINVEMFGRETPVELNFSEVKKM